VFESIVKRNMFAVLISNDIHDAACVMFD
jgi:hypothetical protein